MCPRCGSPMRRATAKRGPRAGLALLRCTDFSCPTIINIEDRLDETRPAPRPGESAQAIFEFERAAYVERIKRGVVLLAALGILVALGMFFFFLIFFSLPIAALITTIMIIIAIIAIFRWLPDEVMRWGRGAEAERRVGARLDALEPLGFVSLFDRRLIGRGGNIDAVTVGPPGVFVIETKHRGRGVEVVQGRFEVGGREQGDAIRQVLDIAMYVQLSVASELNRHRLTVIPVVCVGNRAVGGGDRAGGVLVVDERSLSKRLSALPGVLEPEDVQRLARALDQALPPFERRTA